MPVVIAVLALLLAVRDCLAKQALGGVSQEGRCGYTSCTQDPASQSLRMSVAMQKKKALRKKEEEEPVDLSFLEAEAASAAAASASADHGSRAQRGAIAEAALEKREQDAAAKQARHAFPHLYSQSGRFTALHSMQETCEAGCADGGSFAVGIGHGWCMLLMIQRSAGCCSAGIRMRWRRPTTPRWR